MWLFSLLSDLRDASDQSRFFFSKTESLVSVKSDVSIGKNLSSSVNLTS